MPKGVRPENCVGVKGKSGRKSISEEIITKAKERIYLDVMKEMMPDILLAEKHLEGLNATKKEGVGGMAMGISKGKIESIGHTDKIVADYPTRAKYLEMAYKIRGDFAPEKFDHTTLGESIVNTDKVKTLANDLRRFYRRGDIGSNGTSSDTMGGEISDKE